MWRVDENKEKLNPSAVKLVRDVKLQYSVVAELAKGEDKKMFYLFNFIPRMLSKALCLTSLNFVERKINQAGILYMQEAMKYMTDKLSPIIKIANSKLLVDYTFASLEDKSNDFEKALLFYEIMLSDDEGMIKKIKESKHMISPEDAVLLMTTNTHLRKAMSEEMQNNLKKEIFSSQ